MGARGAPESLEQSHLRNQVFNREYLETLVSTISILDSVLNSAALRQINVGRSRSE